MSAATIALSAFAVILVSMVAGLWLRRRLPERHLKGDSKEVIHLATALVATMSALVLALLFASTRGSYETTRSAVDKLAANVIELDKLLEDYGEKGLALRRVLRRDVDVMANAIWRGDGPKDRPFIEPADHKGQLASRLSQLAPGTAQQNSLQARAAEISHATAELRLSLQAQPSDAISKPFVVVLVLWLCFIFATFAMSSDANATLIGVLFFSALSASSAIYLILELGQPFGGLMQIPSTPLRHALAPIG